MRAGDDAAEASWFSFGSLPDLAFDHKMIIETAWKRHIVLPEGDKYKVLDRGSGKVLQELTDPMDAETVMLASPFGC